MQNSDYIKDDISIDEDTIEMPAVFPEFENEEGNYGDNEPTASSVTKRRGRGKASGDLKLSSALLATNQILQEKFIHLRQAIFAPTELSRQERVRMQRHILADILGVHDKLVRAMEKTPSPLPATAMFALIERYNLPVNYFTLRETTLSQQFIIEQKMKEFEYKLTVARLSPHGSSGNAQNYVGIAPKRGGWLKGLPRKITCEHDSYLVAMWEEAKRRNFHPESVEDMLRWVNENDVTLNPEVLAQSKKVEKQVSKRGKSGSVRRHSGWMLGLTRHPRTEEELEHHRIWQIARSQHLHFNTVKEMMAWWVVEGKK